MNRFDIIPGLCRLPSLPLIDAFMILTVWATYLLPVLVGGVGVSHVTGMVLIVFCGRAALRHTSREQTSIFFLFFAILMLSILSAGLVGFQARFPFEAIKTALVFLMTFFIGLTVSPDRIRTALDPGPWLFLILVAGVFMFVGKPFAVDGRLQIEGFLSSNVMGFLAVLNGAVLLNRRKLNRLDYATLLLLFLIMLMCLSRSALMETLALIWVRIGWTRGAVILGSLGGTFGILFAGNKVIQRMLVIEDVLTTGGSGRSSLWSFLVNNWWDNPSAWLFGFGPGAVHRHPNWLATEDNAHSMLIGSIYYWGLVGFVFLLGVFVLAMRDVAKAPWSRERSLARDILLITAVNCVVDESYNASQINAISALFFALVLAVVIAARRQRVQNFTLSPAS